MFGWARPMSFDGPVRSWRVAWAGPAANAAVALAAALACRLAAWLQPLSPDFLGLTRDFLRFLTDTNLFLAFFHLLPLHPLDGSHALAGVLSPGARRVYERLAPACGAAVLALVLIRPLSVWAALPAQRVAALLMRAGLLG